MVCNEFVFLQEMTHMEVVNGELPDAEKLSKIKPGFISIVLVHPTQWPVCTAYGNYVHEHEVSLLWHFSILWNAIHLACVCVCVCVCACSEYIGLVVLCAMTICYICR